MYSTAPGHSHLETTEGEEPGAGERAGSALERGAWFVLTFSVECHADGSVL